MAEITAEEKTVNRIMNDDYLIEIPLYQRPYSWNIDHVSELFGDLHSAMGRDDDTHYFLGSIIMISRDNGRHHELIDGQQRLTTLTMLLCVARDLTDDPTDQEKIHKYVAQPADKYEGTTESPRLLVRRRDRNVFNEWVQKRGGTTNVTADTAVGQSDSQQRMAENIELLRDYLKDLTAKQRDDLVSFIVTRCYLIVATTTDRESAYRMFSVLNDRGLNLSPTDILKAEVIGKLPKETQQSATDQWEAYEDALGRDSFRDLFQIICSIYVKDKIHHALQTAFQKSVLDEMSADLFLANVLTPYADAYTELLTSSHLSPSGNQDSTSLIDNSLRHIMRLEDYTVMPPVLAFLRHFGRHSEGAQRFFADMERLAFGLRILRLGVEARIRRYGKIVTEVESAAADKLDSDSLDWELFRLTDEEKDKIMGVLDGPIGEHTLCKQILLVLDSHMSDAGATYDRPNCTLEHVLPKQPSADSEWLTRFPNDTARVKWTQRLGNLVLLSRRKNSKASNYEFSRKRDQYFKSSSVAPFALTVDVLQTTEWTEDILSQRQERLLGALKTRWRLG